MVDIMVSKQSPGNRREIMASANLNEKANGTRLSRLLVDKGTEALRRTFDGSRPPGTLAAVFNSTKPKLLRLLKGKIITNSQWDILYPPAGTPNSKNFDVTLLMILLRNICSLPKPSTGWNTMPPDTDRSVEGNVVRIKLFRNEVYAHIPNTETNDTLFECLWQSISNTLVDLGIPQHEIDELKEGPLSPEEEIYVQKLKDWKEREERLEEKLDELKRMVQDLSDLAVECQHGVRETQSAMTDLRGGNDNDSKEILLKLAKYNFRGDVRRLVKLFQEGTRKWLLKKLSDWFADQESRVMILTAGPGVGKSVFAGKVCQAYEETGKLAAYHFCKFNDSNLSNPLIMLQNLASHMCDSIKRFKDKLLEQLKRPYNIHCLADAFRVYLSEPLHDLQGRTPMLIVIDGLDESEADGKSELLDLIAEEFSDLPEWVKILVTSKPEIPVKKKLSHLKPVEVLPNDEDNKADLKQYLEFFLPSLCTKKAIIPLLVERCQGSFLFAFHVQSELLKRENLADLTAVEIQQFLPERIGYVYKKYFDRLQNELKAVDKRIDLFSLLKILAAARGPLPLKFIAEVLQMSAHSVPLKEIINQVNERLSALLFISGELVTVFHKSLADWLTANGYDHHPYEVNRKDGDELLWRASEKEFKEIKDNILALNQTTAMKYSLRYGCSHLVAADTNYSLESVYTWLVDMAIVYETLENGRENVDVLRKNWNEILKRTGCVSPRLELQILWHRTFVVNSRDSDSRSYLENVVNESCDFFSDQDKRTAKSLLKKHVWCEKLSAPGKEDRNLVLAQRLFSSAISCVGVAANKQLIATGHEDGTVCLLDLKLHRVYKGAARCCRVPCCVFSPDNSVLLCGRLDTCLDVRTQSESSFFLNCNDKYTSCSFSPSGNRLLTSDGSEIIKLWDVNEQRLLALLRSSGPINSCQFSESGLFIVGKILQGEAPESSCDSTVIWNAISLQRVDQRHPIIFKLGKVPVWMWEALRTKKTDTELMGLVRTALERGGFEKVDVDIVTNVNSDFSIAGVNKCFCDQGTEIILCVNNFDRDVYLLPQLFPVARLRRSPMFRCNQFEFKHNNSICMLKCGSNSWKIIHPFHYTQLAVYLFSSFDYALMKSNWIGRFVGNVNIVSEEEVLYHCNDELLLVNAPSKRPIMHVSSNFKSKPLEFSFSPDGSRLVSCSNDGMIRIWDVHTCRVVQSFPWVVSSGCYWSKRYLWTFQIVKGKAFLSRWPVDQQLAIKCSKGNHRPLDPEINEALTFSEGILVLKCEDNSISVLNVSDEKFRPSIKLPSNHPVKCAAVSPGGSCVLTADSKKYQIWRENGMDLHQYSLKELGEICRCIRCSITSDGKLGIIVCTTADDFLDQGEAWCQVIDMHSGDFLKRHYIPYMASRLRGISICTGCTFFALKESSSDVVIILDIATGKERGLWSRSPVMSTTSEKYLTFSREYNILAVPNNFGHMDFIRIHIPEQC